MAIVNGKPVNFGHVPLNKTIFTNLKAVEAKDDIQKGTLSYQLGYNGTTGQGLTFDKTGAEIKTAAMTKITGLAEEKGMWEQKATLLLTELEEAGCKPTEPYRTMKGYSQFAYEETWFKTENAGEDDKALCRKKSIYNNTLYSIANIDEDIKYLETVSKNIQEKKAYKLNTEQLMALGF